MSEDTTITIIGVRFKKAGKIYYFDPDDNNIEKDTPVIVETVRGVEYGITAIPNREVNALDVVQPLKKVVRVATEEDKKRDEENREKEKQAFSICIEKISKHGLDMKLIDVEVTFDHNKLIFYFTSDGRVDFRELVKELASIFRTRIELRQIGVRDEAKMLNGIGICGRTLCCATFLGDFQPVSIKMAKDQGMSLNPTKISGMCGRLMCCLKYEEETYIYLTENLPSVGDIVKTCDGRGEVLSVNLLGQVAKVAVRPKENDDPVIGFYSTKEIEILVSRKPEQSEEELEKLAKLGKRYDE